MDDRGPYVGDLDEVDPLAETGTGIYVDYDSTWADDSDPADGPYGPAGTTWSPTQWHQWPQDAVDPLAETGIYVEHDSTWADDSDPADGPYGPAGTTWSPAQWHQGPQPQWHQPQENHNDSVSADDSFAETLDGQQCVVCGETCSPKCSTWCCVACCTDMSCSVHKERLSDPNTDILVSACIPNAIVSLISLYPLSW